MPHLRSLPLRRSWLAALACLLSLPLAAAHAHAGVLCGTVRDALTQQPIDRAGVFVRTTAGAYTGFHAATDAQGEFCISGIPAGTYDVEVRVDEYFWTYLPNVVIDESTTDVGDALVPRLALLAPAPNPARHAVKLRFSLGAPGPAALEVVDLTGRRVMGWRSPQLAAGAHEVAWNLRDLDERAIPAGRYWVSLSAGGSRQVRSLLRIP